MGDQPPAPDPAPAIPAPVILNASRIGTASCGCTSSSVWLCVSSNSAGSTDFAVWRPGAFCMTCVCLIETKVDNLFLFTSSGDCRCAWADFVAFAFGFRVQLVVRFFL